MEGQTRPTSILRMMWPAIWLVFVSKANLENKHHQSFAIMSRIFIISPLHWMCNFHWNIVQIARSRKAMWHKRLHRLHYFLWMFGLLFFEQILLAKKSPSYTNGAPSLSLSCSPSLPPKQTNKKGGFRRNISRDYCHNIHQRTEQRAAHFQSLALWLRRTLLMFKGKKCYPPVCVGGLLLWEKQSESHESAAAAWLWNHKRGEKPWSALEPLTQAVTLEL